MSSPQVSVIVPAMNAAATLGATLAALAAQHLDDDFEVIVVDDGSSDQTAAIAAAAGPPVRVVSGPRSGPGPARNRGVAEANGSRLAFLDADCVPEPGWLAAGLRALDSADLVQGRVEPVAAPGPFDHTVWVIGPSPLFESANLLVARPLFERLGGFEDWLGAIDPRAAKPLAEDTWFGWRARRGGARIAFAPEALVRHAVIARGPRAYVAERRRLVHFPAIVAKVPELRRELLVGGLFLDRRAAIFDLAVAGLALAAGSRTPRPLVACLPYLALEARRALPHRRNAALVGAADLAADTVGLGAKLAGSWRRRTAVL